MEKTGLSLPWIQEKERFDSLLDKIHSDAEVLSCRDSFEQMSLPTEVMKLFIDNAGAALDFLNGKKWGYHVVCSLFLTQRPLGFNEISGLITGISNRALSTRLKETVEMGLVNRTVDEGPPMRTYYHLTEHGLTITTLLAPLVYYMEKKQGLHDVELSEILNYINSK